MSLESTFPVLGSRLLLILDVLAALRQRSHPRETHENPRCLSVTQIRDLLRERFGETRSAEGLLKYLHAFGVGYGVQHVQKFLRDNLRYLNLEGSLILEAWSVWSVRGVCLGTHLGSLRQLVVAIAAGEITEAMLKERPRELLKQEDLVRFGP